MAIESATGISPQPLLHWRSDLFPSLGPRRELQIAGSMSDMEIYQ